MTDTRSVDGVLEVTAQVLIRCAFMGAIVLLIWWGVLGLAGDLAYNAHARIVPMSRQQFDLIHYASMLITKASMSLLFLFPYIAIRFVMAKGEKESSNSSSGGDIQ